MPMTAATMPVPGASALFGSSSPADQVSNETEEARKKRLAAMQSSKQLPGMSDVVGAGYGAAMGG